MRKRKKLAAALAVSAVTFVAVVVLLNHEEEEKKKNMESLAIVAIYKYQIPLPVPETAVDFCLSACFEVWCLEFLRYFIKHEVWG